MNIGFNILKMNSSTHMEMFIIQEMFNSFKYKCEALFMCVSIYTSRCNMHHLNNGFNKFKVNDLIHGKMLIVQKM